MLEAGNYYLPNDNASAYIGLRGNRVFFYAEKPGPRVPETNTRSCDWALVFDGRKNSRGSIIGSWWHVPKGRSRGTGTLSFHEGGPVTSGFPGYVLSGLPLPLRAPARLRRGRAPTNYLINARPQPACYRAIDDESDLTGTWIGDRGTYCYIREVRDRVVWYAEQCDEIGNASLAIAFSGRRNGNTISGNYAYLAKPRNPRGGGGSITVQLESPWEMRSKWTSGHLLDRTYWRVDGYWLSYYFRELDVRDGNDEAIEAENPLLWMGRWKVDGETLSPSDPRRHSTRLSFHPHQASQPLNRELAERLISTGQKALVVPFNFLPFRRTVGVEIPRALGWWTSLFLTAPGLDPRSQAAKTVAQNGVVICALEHDNSSEQTLETAFARFKAHAQDIVRSSLGKLNWSISPPTGGAISNDTSVKIAAITSKLRSVVAEQDSPTTNSSDVIDTKLIWFTWADFDPDGPDQVVPGGPVPRSRQISLTLEDNTARYVLLGFALARGGTEKVDARNVSGATPFLPRQPQIALEGTIMPDIIGEIRSQE